MKSLSSVVQVQGDCKSAWPTPLASPCTLLRKLYIYIYASFRRCASVSSAMVCTCASGAADTSGEEAVVVWFVRRSGWGHNAGKCGESAVTSAPRKEEITTGKATVLCSASNCDGFSWQ